MKRVTALFLAAVLLLSLAACGGKDPWQEQYDLGMRYLNEGSYQEAVIAFEAAIEIDPKRPEAYLGAAEAYIKLDQPEEAEKILRRGYEETQDDRIYDKLIKIQEENKQNQEQGEVYWASFIGRPLRDICQYLDMTFESEWWEGYAAVFRGHALVYCDTSYSNLEAKEEDTVHRVEVAGAEPVLPGIIGGMTYPDLMAALEGRVQLEEPQDTPDMLNGNYNYSLSFELDGYQLYYYWYGDPYQEESRSVTIYALWKETPTPQDTTEEILITEEEARELISNYWNYTPGDIAEETGFPLYIISDGLEPALSGKHYYKFRLRWLVNGDHLSTIDFAMVDAKTGECLPDDSYYQ